MNKVISQDLLWLVISSPASAMCGTLHPALEAWLIQQPCTAFLIKHNNKELHSCFILSYTLFVFSDLLK